MKLSVRNYKSGLPNFPTAMAMGFAKQKFHGLVATRGPSMAGADEKRFDFGRSRSLEDAFLSVWFASIHHCKYGQYQFILLTEPNQPNTLKPNTNLRCFRETSKPYLTSLPDFNTVNTANHKRQFHKHGKRQKQGPQTSRQQQWKTERPGTLFKGSR